MRMMKAMSAAGETVTGEAVTGETVAGEMAVAETVAGETVAGKTGPAAGAIAALRGSGRGFLLRLGLFNLGAVALLAAAFGEGWVQRLFAADSTGLTYVIAAVFVTGLVFGLVRGGRIAREIDCARSGWARSGWARSGWARAGWARSGRARAGGGCDGSWSGAYLGAVDGRGAGARAIAASALRGQVAARIAPVRHFAASLVMLGLIGTVLGFILALSGISASMTPDVGAVSGMISRLIAGMSVALYTTLEGSVLSLWLTVNHQILGAGAARLVSGLVMLGERDARS